MIELKKVSFKYPGCENSHDRVLFNIDLRFEKGKFYSVIGTNGSGKSSMARLLNGLLYPYEGEIFVDGMLVKPENFSEIRQKVGYIFQNPENQIVSTLVENEVAFALENLGYSFDDMHKKVPEILKYVELEKYAKTPPHMLSGGQKQRLAIASVVIIEPDFIIFDEPTSMLDYNGRLEVIELINRLHEHGRTVILISHDIDEILLADEIIILDEGKLIAKVTPKEFLADSSLREKAHFMDLPEHIEVAMKMGLDFYDKDLVAKEVAIRMLNVEC